MTDIVVLLVVGLIVGWAIGYIYRQKRKGNHCIGCPDGANCSGHCGSCAGCKGCGEKMI